MAIVGWPPVLRGRHHRFDILLQRINVKGLDRLSVVEILAHRIGRGRILAENLQVQLIRPPVLVGSHFFVPPVKCSEYGATFSNRCKPADRKNKRRSLVPGQGESDPGIRASTLRAVHRETSCLVSLRNRLFRIELLAIAAVHPYGAVGPTQPGRRPIPLPFPDHHILQHILFLL